MPPSTGSGNFADDVAAGLVPILIRGYSDHSAGPPPWEVFRRMPMASGTSAAMLPNGLTIFTTHLPAVRNWRGIPPVRNWQISCCPRIKLASWFYHRATSLVQRFLG